MRYYFLAICHALVCEQALFEGEEGGITVQMFVTAGSHPLPSSPHNFFTLSLNREPVHRLATHAQQRSYLIHAESFSSALK